MNITTRTALRGTVAAAAATVLAVGTAVAGAQVPGAEGDGIPVNVTSDALVVMVNEKGEEPAEVTGTIENTSGSTFRCATPGSNLQGEYPGQVTTAGVVDLAVDYYRTNIFTGFEEMDLGDSLDPIGMGSVLDILPAGSDAGSAAVDSRQGQNAARAAGRTGNPEVGGNTAFNVDAGDTVDWTAQLDLPATGDRGEWRAAAMFFCVDQSIANDTRNSFVFYGFEDIPDPNPIDPDASGSLSAGSLGS